MSRHNREERRGAIEVEIGDVQNARRPEQPDPTEGLTKEELQILDTTENFSLLDLDPNSLDPERHYRWARADDLRIARMKAKGYRIEEVDEEHPILNMLGEKPGDTSEGVYRVSDVILMSTKKQVFRVRRARIKKLTRARVGEAKGKFKKLAAKASRKAGHDIDVITDKED